MRCRRLLPIMVLVVPMVTPAAASSDDAEATPPICEAWRHRLKLVFTSSDEDWTMGNHMMRFAFVNRSDESCRMYGHPLVSLYADDGTRFDAYQVNNCCYVNNSDPPERVVVAPGGAAHFGVVELACVEPSERAGAAEVLMAMPPGEDRTLAVRVPAPGILVCTDGRFGVTTIRGSSDEL